MSEGFAQLGTFLFEYLEDQGIDPTRKFSCIFPDHNDSDASAHIYKNTMIKCFGCGRVATIFDAAHIFDGLPQKGDPHFYRFNVLEMAKRYGVGMPSWIRSSLLPIYNQVIDYILNPYLMRCSRESGVEPKELFHSWAPAPALVPIQKETPICLRSPSHEELVDHLLAQGHKQLDIDRAGINHRVFSEGAILYPLWITRGTCVGFMRRNDPGKKPSHYGTENNDCFTKGEYLDGLFLSPENTKPVYLVEGRKDMLAVTSAGHQALGALTAHLSAGQVDLLLNRRFIKPVFCFDGDDAGKKGTLRGLEELLKRGVLGEACLLPEGEDPYSWVIEKGQELPPIVDGLELLVNEALDKVDGDSLAVANQFIAFLSDIDMATQRHALAGQVAEILDMPAKALQKDVEALVRQKRDKVTERLIETYDSAVTKARDKPELADDYFAEAKKKASGLRTRRLSFSNEDTRQNLMAIESGEGDLSQRDVHFRPDGLGVITDLFHEGGLGYTSGTLILVPGDPHTGKTALLNQASMEWLLGGEDTMLIHFSTDDAIRFLMPRMISALIFDPSFYIADAVKIPVPGSRKGILRQRAMDQLGLWIADNRLVMKDRTFSRRLSDAGEMVSYYREKYPDRRILLVNDNMHRNSDYQNMDENQRIEMICGDGKDLAGATECTVWASVEYRKGKLNHNGDPADADIAGGRGSIYEASGIVHMNNDFARNGCDIDKCVYVHDYGGVLLPRVLVSVTKNKIGGTTGVAPFDMFPKQSFFRKANHEVVAAEAFQRRMLLNDEQNQWEGR